MNTFQLADLQNKINAQLDQLQGFLLARGEAAIQDTAQSLSEHRQRLRNRPLLSLAFTGQFNAGKSTIISALTGNKDIHISADIATDEVKPYQWREIDLWDTPGLYADRADHTAKAERAQRDADLVVYCLTTNLFDDITANDFRDLAYTKGYMPKIFLLINKFSMEDVDDTTVYINNLSKSIDRTLSPHRLSEFNHAFIDAQDYKDGIATSSPELIIFSRFEAFVDQLNTWIKQRGLLARLDPPIRLGLSTIDDALATLPEQPFAQNPNLFVLNQQLRILQNQQRRTDIEVRRLGSGVVHQIQELGEQLLNNELGDDPKLAEGNFESRCEEINQSAFEDLTQLIQNDYQHIQSKLEDFAKDPLIADYFAAVDTNQTTSVPSAKQPQKSNSNSITDVAKNLIGKGAEKFGLKDGLFVGAKEVAGGAGHKLIYNVGKMLGKNFRPWEAVKMAKGLGQAIGVLGIAMAAYDIYEQVNHDAKDQEQQRGYEQQLNAIRAQFRQLGETMADQLSDIYKKEYALPVVISILEKLQSARDDILAQDAANKEFVGSLSTHRAELMEFLRQLYDIEQFGDDGSLQ